MMRHQLIGCAALLFALSASARAQSLRTQCDGVAAADQPLCRSLADAALTLPARTAIAAAAGNPVSGTASTLGMRTPGSPRWSIALRGNAARATLPPAGTAPAVEPTLWSVSADASVGVFNGFYLLPTVGGFASLDVLGSVGVLGVPEDGGLDSSSPVTWALGTRIGILRESFTSPGVSISAMYRKLPDVRFGARPDFSNSDQSVLSFRGTVGKRVLGAGITGGIGYDRARADVQTEYTGSGPLSPIVRLEERGVTSSRTSYFGNLSYTLLILNIAAELGWQADGAAPPDAHRDAGKGGLFGGVAVRLAI